MSQEEKEKLYCAIDKVKTQIDVFGDSIVTTIVAISLLTPEERNLVATMIREKNIIISRCSSVCSEQVFASMVKNRMYIRWVNILNMGRRKKLRFFVFALKISRLTRLTRVSFFDKLLKSAMLYFIKPLAGVKYSQT
ncbi:MAG: hypothetical protein PHE89_03655 [Alphaproteobacteria bacterium]|nr:hypothetical protein [Alphaproteobacteria bacterium]